MEDLNFVDKIKSIIKEIITGDKDIYKYKDVLRLWEGIPKFIQASFRLSEYGLVIITTVIDDEEYDSMAGDENDNIIHLKYLYYNIDRILEPFKSRIPFLYDLGKDLKDFNLTINGNSGSIRGILSNRFEKDIQDKEDSIKVVIKFKAHKEEVELDYNYSDCIKRYDFVPSDDKSVNIDGEEFEVNRHKDEDGKDFCILSKTIFRTLPKLPPYHELMDTSKVEDIFKSLDK